MMKTDLIIRWNKKEHDLEAAWNEGHRTAALSILTSIRRSEMFIDWNNRPFSFESIKFDKSIIDKLEDMGYDLKTLKITIQKRSNPHSPQGIVNKKIVENESTDKNHHTG